MEPSSTNKLPEGVKEDDLYDGPPVAHLPSGNGAILAPPLEPQATPPRDYGPQQLARPLPAPPPVTAPTPAPVATAVVKSAYPELIRVCLDILATKVHTLLVLLVGAGIWGYSTYDPQPYRIGVAVGYSLLVIMPMLWIYGRTGTKGEVE